MPDALSAGAEAMYRGTTVKPTFAHHLCWPIDSPFNWKYAHPYVEVRGFDRCAYCGGAMHEEPTDD